MADLVTQLYDPLYRYHQKGGDKGMIDNTKAATLATNDAIALGGEIAVRPNIKKLLESLETSGGSTTQKSTNRLSDAIIEKWKSDKSGNFIKALDADLGKDPKLTERLAMSIKANPDQIATRIASYQPGNLAAVLPAQAAPAAAGTSTAKPSPVSSPAEPITPPQQKATSKPAAAAAPKPGPAEATVRETMVLDPNEEIVKTPAPTPKDNALSNQIATGIFIGLADKTDAEISAAVDANMVKGIAKSMSQEAITKYGVQEPAAKAFLKKIAGPQEPGESKDGYDPQLADNIAANLKRNPEFVRQLAKAAKNKEPMDKAMVDMARPTMTGVMENPEKLADDKYVKDLSQKMNMGSSMGGFGKILNNIFGEGFGNKISGWFHAIVDQIKSWISGFTGDKQVISMKSGGNGSFLPTVMVNLDAINANRAAAAAQARYNPLSMTALSQKGTDGKFFHEEQVKGSDGKPAVTQDGKPVVKTVANGLYTITDVNGKEHKVMPSVGVLEAKQDRDGNVHGRFVTKINQNGVSDEIDTIQVSATEFKKYQDATNKRASEAGLNKTVAYSPYTVQDAANDAQGKTIQMASVDPKTGTASAVTTVNVGTPQEAGPGVGYTVVNGTVMRKAPATNDPQYELQGNG